MKSDSGRRWLIAAVGLFLLLLVGWVLLALQLNIALAGPLPFAPRLRSNLPADYRADDGSVPIGVISLSIDEAVQALRQSLGLTDEEAAAQRASLELAMSQPVPTATALNFTGDAPFTSTPTVTHTPLPTDTPTRAPSRTPSPPTETPKPTRTPESARTSEPTDMPTPTGAATTVPTAAPTAAGDSKHPSLDLSGATLSPDPGQVAGCSVTFTLENVRVTDPAPSSGIAYVGFKYRIPGYVNDLTLGPEFSLVSGGPAGDGWYGIYSGSLTIDIFSGWNATVNTGSTDFHIQLWVKTYDEEGHEDVVSLGDYYLSASCDDA